MFTIGCHLSISKGFYKSAQEAGSIGANTFQFFTRNPRGGKAKAIDREDISKCKTFIRENSFGKLFAHASYTMNLCSDKEQTRKFALEILKDDLERLKMMPDCYYIFHPGAHVGQGVEKGTQLIVKALNESTQINPDQFILLEGMSGKGTEIGKTFEELQTIIMHSNSEKIGVCLDTCHLYSAGYDIVGQLEAVLDNFDKIIGLSKLKAIHLNDSKTEFNSNKDRHEQIGKGSIGLEAFRNIINHPNLKELPFNLETPLTPKEHAKEIDLLKHLLN